MTMKTKQDKRALLVATAKKLFYKRGYNQTSLADIAALSGIRVGNIYYYFKTKEQLVQAIIEDRTERFITLSREWESSEDPKYRLHKFLERLT